MRLAIAKYQMDSIPFVVSKAFKRIKQISQHSSCLVYSNGVKGV